MVRACHDQRLVAEHEANGVHELAARALLLRWASRTERLGRRDVQALLGTPVQRVEDPSDPRPLRRHQAPRR